MSDDVLFECDFSIDELAVLADLLEIPALPGGDPDFELLEAAEAAAARGLLARGVVVADGPAGSVEITQPYATMIAVVLFGTEATVHGDGASWYRSGDAALTVEPADAGLVRWAMHPTSNAPPKRGAVAEARRDNDSVIIAQLKPEGAS